MEFNTKIAIVLRDDLAVWQKLNVTSFLTSGILGANPSLLGQEYKDSAGNIYLPLLIQPVIILSCDDQKLRTIHHRGIDRGVRFCLYIEDMFSTSHDDANRATVSDKEPDNLPIVGLALREERKLVDKITKGAKMHP
ncbi:MAG: hypothetical protein CMM39_05510 [Rhodospirillaceae bacterium]|nr:hypothetical protein [Rhodospirillaceae bacterium]|tara:strand:+ start:485 stop:895 length:411 start_codon:yes stop_codon:yes gene_type:complete